jgi:hypothetical protein
MSDMLPGFFDQSMILMSTLEKGSSLRRPWIQAEASSNIDTFPLLDVTHFLKIPQGDIYPDRSHLTQPSLSISSMHPVFSDIPGKGECLD